MGRNQFDLYKLQNQLATGRKMVTPSDDPIAAAQALATTKSLAMSDQFQVNQENAEGQLGVVDAQLDAMDNLLRSVRDKVIQAGNAVLSNADRRFIAEGLESQFSELMGIANAQDGTGGFLFSGYQSAVRPFSQTTTGAAYAGDDGSRLLQVSNSRQMPGNISGKELFERIRNGNGTFVTSNGGNVLGGQNTGTAIIDQGSVNDLSLWNEALNTTGFDGVNIRFFVSGGVTSYRLYDTATPPVEISTTGADPLPGLPYGPGAAIDLAKTTAPAQDFGVSVVISGAPSDGDQFMIKPSREQSIFETLRNTINTISQGISTTAGTTTTEYTNNLAANLVDIDRALENVLNVRTTVGTRLSELDALKDNGEDLQIQYKTSLSALQDLDYAQAISDLSQKQIQLEAAQISFRQISQLSLFSII
jgi:flagellar hook-associated protein 3 FlgL